jgi:hypothetical protein
MDDLNCHQCGANQPSALGTLGDHLWLRCRGCGWQWSILTDEWMGTDPQEEDDNEMQT